MIELLLRLTLLERTALLERLAELVPATLEVLLATLEFCCPTDELAEVLLTAVKDDLLLELLIALLVPVEFVVLSLLTELLPPPAIEALCLD